MPLIILGLIVLLSILVYALVRYMREFHSDKSVRDIVQSFAAPENDSQSYADLNEEVNPYKGDDNSLLFPTDNLETEKHKRNIH